MNKLPIHQLIILKRFGQHLGRSFIHFFKKIIQLQTWRNLGQKMMLRRNLPYTLSVFLSPFLLFFALDGLFPIRPKLDYSPIILAQDSTVLHTYLTQDQKWRLKIELNEIIPELRKTLIYKEDKYFYYHPGINLVAMGRAFFRNLIYFKKTSGASTITMQVARLLEPKRRTYINKFWEVLRALQLEWHYSKDEILQIYVNHLPYGSNIEGIKSAALFYFNRMPHQLSLAQIVTLTIIPNRPTSLVIGKNNQLIKQERNKWLKRLLNSQLFLPQNLQNALNEELRATRLPAPAYAPHFCHRIKKKYPQANTIYTTLNWQQQEKVQQLTLNFIRRLEVFNIHNASVLVLNNRTGKVEVYVGSADFNDKFNSGEVDGIQGVRSPGSTLKPLVYALGIDQGIISPKTILADVPSSFSGFAPENFYKKFSGKVSVEQALVQSLNIPAVKILETIGIRTFINKLKLADFEQISKDEKKLGLSLILGGCGVTLEEMVNLFGAFAQEGNFRSGIFLQNDSLPPKIKLVSPEAAYTITEILATAQRPDLPSSFENTYRIPKIAWKTGTSYGRRDAWSIGYNAQYTVGVWVGNFSGEGVNNLVGAEVATPLLFDVFNSINYNPENDWFKAPKNLKVRWVCSESGLVPNDFCPNQVIDYYLPLVSTAQKCQHLKEIIVANDEKMSYCLTCQPIKAWKKKLYPNFAPELLAYYEAKGLKINKIPPHNPACTRVLELDAPVILSPLADKEYIIDRQNPPELELICKVSNEVKMVYWYINHEFYRAASPSEKVFFKPQLGLIHLACSDDQGRNAETQIRVSYE
jgi:penicillin-binding protein 1C